MNRAMDQKINEVVENVLKTPLISGTDLHKMIEEVVSYQTSGLTLKDKQIINDAREKKIPVFIFTAKDSLSVRILYFYRSLCRKFCNTAHIEGVDNRLKEFVSWQDEHKEEVKDPD
jgi:deoxyhypusine synthase